jgi:hypothetical protein
MSTRPLHVASDVLYHIEQTERISKRESLQILYGNKDIKKMNGIWGLKNCYD